MTRAQRNHPCQGQRNLSVPDMCGHPIFHHLRRLITNHTMCHMGWESYGLLPEGAVDEPFGSTAKIATDRSVSISRDRTDHQSPAASNSKFPFLESWKFPVQHTWLKTNARYNRTRTRSITMMVTRRYSLASAPRTKQSIEEKR